MSDDKHNEGEKKDAKKDAKAAVAAGGGIKALLGPILAVVVLVGAGVGVGLFLAKFFAKAPETTGTKVAGHGEHGATEHGEGEGEGEHAGHSLLHTAKELVIEDVVANIKEQGGKRFVKIVPAFWVTTEAAAALGLNGGGHGGGEVGGEIKRIIKARIEESLKQYDLEELTSQSIYKRLEKSLKDLADKEIKAFAPELPATQPVVLKVVLSGLVVQ